MLFWSFVAYFFVGILKLRFFDRNRDGEWLVMLSDDRSRYCSGGWVYVLALVLWLTWPTVFFGEKVSLARSFFIFQWRYL